MTTRVRLGFILGAVLSAVFVSLLAAFTRDLALFWPLYAVPVAAAAIAYHEPGSIVAGMGCGLAAAVIYHSMPVAGSPGLGQQLALGLSAFTAATLLVARQLRVSESHRVILEANSLVDESTGLINRRYGDERLDQEFARAVRCEYALTLALLAVKGFDDYVETLGRRRADQLARRVADVLRLNVRQSDLLFRWAQDRFAVVMPFQPLETAQSVVRRLGTAVSGGAFEGDEVEPIVACTLLGVSVTYPTEAASLQDVVAKAEGRLRRALDAAREPAAQEVSQA